ncbi:hypothetical protein M8J76_011521 [Diaphorina citri]|nr:hypothetical protein M8J76_011521 [Diaphorina citri]
MHMQSFWRAVNQLSCPYVMLLYICKESIGLARTHASDTRRIETLQIDEAGKSCYGSRAIESWQRIASASSSEPIGLSFVRKPQDSRLIAMMSPCAPGQKTRRPLQVMTSCHAISYQHCSFKTFRPCE